MHWAVQQCGEVTGSQDYKTPDLLSIINYALPNFLPSFTVCQRHAVKGKEEDLAKQQALSLLCHCSQHSTGASGRPERSPYVYLEFAQQKANG